MLKLSQKRVIFEATKTAYLIYNLLKQILSIKVYTNQKKKKH